MVKGIINYKYRMYVKYSVSFCYDLNIKFEFWVLSNLILFFVFFFGFMNILLYFIIGYIYEEKSYFFILIILFLRLFN